MNYDPNNPLEIDFDNVDPTTATFSDYDPFDAENDPVFEARVQTLFAQREATHNILAALRTAAGLTQEQVADAWDRHQETVSRLERSDLMRASLRTIAEFVEALGGRLHLVAELRGARVELPIAYTVDTPVVEREVRRAG